MVQRVPVEVRRRNDDRVLAASPARRENRVEGDRTRQHEDEEDAEREAEVADAVDDEGLDGGGAGRRLFVPEADQQVGGEADAFPAEEHLHELSAVTSISMAKVKSDR